MYDEAALKPLVYEPRMGDAQTRSLEALVNQLAVTVLLVADGSVRFMNEPARRLVTDCAGWDLGSSRERSRHCVQRTPEGWANSSRQPPLRRGGRCTRAGHSVLPVRAAGRLSRCWSFRLRSRRERMAAILQRRSSQGQLIRLLALSFHVQRAAIGVLSQREPRHSKPFAQFVVGIMGRTASTRPAGGPGTGLSLSLAI